MDPISTGLGGALLARALPRDGQFHAGPAAVLAVTTASVLPDADVFLELFVDDPMALFTIHRGFTHSLFGVVVMSPLLAFVLKRVSREKDYPRLLALAALGFLWHLFTDLCTSWGTIVFYPFSRARVVWDVLFIIDFTFTAILLFPHLVAWIYREPAGAFRRGALTWLVLSGLTAALVGLGGFIFAVPYPWGLLLLLLAAQAGLLAAPALRGWGFSQRPAVFCRIGVVVLAIYLGVCAGAHHLALARVRQFSATRGLQVESQAALPQLLSPFRWSGLVLTPGGVYHGWFNVLDARAPEFELFPSAQNAVVARAQALPQVQIYLWFARFPVVSYREEGGRHVVQYTDLRFRTPTRRSAFMYRVVFDGEGGVLSSSIVEP